ncbi:MAG: hypothetical protein IKE38_05595, partial [Erysipelotrichaceae bacterium]|nr:hypothetical protein [Erysipelotrichaceae bacterium]
MIKLNRHLKDRALSALKDDNIIGKILISGDASSKLPVFVKDDEYTKVLLAGIKDNEEKINRLKEKMVNEGIECECHIFEGTFVPDKERVGELIVRTPEDTDLMIACGNRQLADLCKYVSTRLGIDCII